jgi:hypothetical protein
MRPQLWYAVAEEYRHDILLYSVGELRVIAHKELGPVDYWTESDLFLEAIRRIYVICGLDLGEG